MEPSADEWTPLPGGVTRHSPHIFSFQVPVAALRARLGSPQFPEVDTNGLGPADAWVLGFPCGLQLALQQLLMGPSGARVVEGESSWVEVYSSERDLDHLRCHLPVPVADVELSTPDSTIRAPRDWWVRRQDDNGHVFDVAAFSSRCEALQHAAELEGRGHKQAYTVEHRRTEGR
jgi:hypothetical protein